MTEIVDLSASMQDYLEAILELEEADSPVRVTDIANNLKIAKASVNQTINKLKDMNLVHQQIYGPVELTESGRELANKIRLRHITLRQFLVQVLGVNPSIAEKDACLMEHAISPQTMDQLTDFLYKNGFIKETGNSKNNSNALDSKLVQVYLKKGISNMNPSTKALSDLKVGQKGIVVKVASKGTVRRRIMEMGITTGAEILVKGFAPFGDPMELGIKGYSLSLRKSEASDIFVEVVN